MTLEEQFRKAADVLREGGWCRMRMADGYGRHCMLGACRAAGGGLGAANAQVFLFNNVCNGGVAAFNDAPDMTADDAIAALEIAADLAA